MRKSEKEIVGTRIREYEILKAIGKGGMGAVYLARHVYLQEERAIKVIHSDYIDQKELVERFIREARMLSRLRHPHLVQLYEFGTLDEHTFFMVLEFIAGQSVLARVRERTRIPLIESIKIVREAALGLQCAHQEGIVHRDISPDNLMLVQSGSGKEITKVIDFGIAKSLFEGSQYFSITGMFLGKLEYCSPEQCGILEEDETIDHRSDIYSLGVTLYHMLTGKTPFYSTTPQGYIVKHVNEIPKPVSSHFAPGEIPQALDDLLWKALAKNRNERHSSMQELIGELERLMETTPFVPGLISSEILPGQLFAKRYLIENKIGSGGMGTVYKAIDQTLNLAVAIKVVNSKIIKDDQTLARLKREVILARRVNHPNVCRIFDISEYEGNHFVSMEFLEGRSLAEILQSEGRMPAQLSLHIITQVLRGLDEAHRLGIVHRDMKPHNIMVDSNRRAYILDFGISLSADLLRVTQTGVLIGTPQYMAPEQFEDKEVDHRADLYSIGIVLFELLTGRLPFEVKTPLSAMQAHLNATPPKVSELVSDLHPDLDFIVFRALQKDPQKRYATAQEFLSDLIRFPERPTVIPSAAVSYDASLSTAVKTIPDPLPKSEVILEKPTSYAASIDAEAPSLYFASVFPQKKKPSGLFRIIVLMGLVFVVVLSVVWLQRSNRSKRVVDIEPRRPKPSSDSTTPGPSTASSPKNDHTPETKIPGQVYSFQDLSSVENYLSENPNDSTTMRKLAFRYAQEGNFDKALYWYQRGATIEPNNAEAHYLIGVICWEKSYKSVDLMPSLRNRIIEIGLTALDRAVQLTSEYADAYLYMNLLYREKAKMISTDPNLVPADRVDEYNALLQKAVGLQQKAMALRKDRNPTLDPEPTSAQAPAAPESVQITTKVDSSPSPLEESTQPKKSWELESSLLEAHSKEQMQDEERFLVFHAHTFDSSGCGGVLYLSSTGVKFVSSEKSEHSFEAGFSSIKEAKSWESFFQLKLQTGKNYNFVGRREGERKIYSPEGIFESFKRYSGW